MKGCPRNFTRLVFLLGSCSFILCVAMALSLRTTFLNFLPAPSSHPPAAKTLDPKTYISLHPPHSNRQSHVGTKTDISRDQKGTDFGRDPRDLRESVPTVHDNAADLKEFRSAQEESRRLHELFLTAEDRSPPPLTAVNCTPLMVQDAWGNTSRGDPALGVRGGGGVGGGSEEAGIRRTRNMTELLDLTQNCTRYLLGSGFRFAVVSEEELSFPLAFSVLVYKDLEQVERLLRAIYRPHNVYCLHADRKASWSFLSGVRHVARCLPNVFLAESSLSVQWGTISVLEPELQCMRQLLAHKAPWRYFINLTGQEFPLKTNRELVRILRAMKGANIISGTTDKQFEFRWKNPKPVPYNLTMNKGDVHIIASRGYVDYVTRSGVARQLYEWLRGSYIPDESFFNTLNYNPQLGVPGSYTGPMDQRSKRTIRSLKIWSFDPKPYECRGKWVRYICHFGVGDLPTLASSPYLIANKFTYSYQPLAYDCIEKWYFDKVRFENAGVTTYLNMSVYENSELVRYRYTGPVLVWE